ncbi:MAG: CBS domain-containing protein [Myxococcales bacterium]|nr:CBS domain-containing protein [Myxococcales bacterium]
MNVGAVMTQDVQVIDVKDGLAEAFQMMRDHGIRHLPVGDGERFVGILSSHDLKQALVPFREGDDGAVIYRLPKGVGIAEIMTRDVTALSSDAHIEDAAQLMIERKVGCVPVIDDGELVGIVTETDLLEVMVEVFGSLRSSAVIEVEIRGGQEELDGLLQSIAKSGATVLSVGQTEGASGRTHRYSIRVRPREIAERVIGVIEEDGHRVLSVID